MQMMMMTSVLVIAALGAGCNKEEKAAKGDAPVALTTANAAKLDARSSIERGRYIVTTAGCHDCHTPLKMGGSGPEPDMSRALSGHPSALVMPPAPELPPGPWLVTVAATNTAWSGPWGVSFTANLTPDKETGLGTWTKQNFMDTIRNARHMGAGRAILPPMPAPVYANLTDDDLGAVFDYLQTVPAISNKVPAPLPPRASRSRPAGG
jgi:mono/diheme cytochrome c family protein